MKKYTLIMLAILFAFAHIVSFSGLAYGASPASGSSWWAQKFHRADGSGQYCSRITRGTDQFKSRKKLHLGGTNVCFEALKEEAQTTASALRRIYGHWLSQYTSNGSEDRPLKKYMRR